MTAQPHPRVGSAAARVRQARCLTQRGAWKTLRGFPPYIRRPPPGRSGAPVGYLAVGWMTAQPHPRVGSAAARGRQARCLTQRGVWRTLRGFPPYTRRPPPGRSGGACWAHGRRVDDGAASSTPGFAGCEGPPGSVPYATGRVENALRFSTLRSRRWPRARLLTSPAPPSCPAGGGRSPCGNRCRSLRRWPGRWSGTWLHADSGE